MKNKFLRLKFTASCCVLIAGAVLLVSFSKKMSAKSNVVIAQKNIAIGTIINEENADKLLAVVPVKGNGEEGDFLYTEDLYGAVITCDISKGQIISDSMVTDDFNPVTDIKEPVVMGLHAMDASQFVSGTLRKGDTINISFVEELNGKCDTILENVFVCGAFNDDGTEISDSQGRAMSINILVEKENEKFINECLHKGQLRISKTGSGLNE